ncbi:MAG: class B sortase [Oscillospiraceae bacterium]|nr:class B sortase [Oscillospiraceae bacterium]
MNDRPNRRREERGAHSRQERMQSRPAERSERSRRNGKRKNGKVLYYGILVLLLAVLVFSSVKIISYMMEKKQSERKQQDLIDQVVTPGSDSNDTENDNTGPDNNTAPSAGSEPDYITVDFKTLQAKYPDVVGWLYCANTGLNYPIVQTAEEGGEYYLYRDIDGSSNKNGTVFLDWQCSSNFTSQNNLVYGHNMKTGRMFAPIVKYRDQSFYDAHPYMYLYTPNQLYKVNLFAGMVTPHDSAVYSYSLSSDYIKECIANSTFKSSVGTPTGNILTLSTCAYDFDNARYVVMGEMVPIDFPSSGN